MVLFAVNIATASAAAVVVVVVVVVFGESKK
jgi:Sec-independent protein translocase protein TatA